jgi:hypothetical protein
MVFTGGFRIRKKKETSTSSLACLISISKSKLTDYIYKVITRKKAVHGRKTREKCKKC